MSSDLVTMTLLRPLDRLRGHLLRRTGPVFRPWIVHRERRIVDSALVGLPLYALLTTLFTPFVLMMGPLLLGPLHLYADIRYLVLRPRWHRVRGFLPWVAAPLLVTTLLGHPAVGLASGLGAALISRGPRIRRAVISSAILVAMSLAVLRPARTQVLLAHLHNPIALGLWFVWRPGSRRRLLPLGLFALIYLSLGLNPWETSTGRWDLSGWYQVLAPGLPLQRQHGATLSFAFAQSVHYAVWLRWIPAEDRPQRTPRNLVKSWRTALADSGQSWVYGTLTVCVTFWVWGFVQAPSALTSYFRLVYFHGYLEIASMVWWACNPGPRRSIHLHREVPT